MTHAVGPGEAARRLGVSTRTVQRWLREGRLASVRVGARLKVDARALPPGAQRPAELSAAVARPIRRLLVANRGELVVRIARTCRALGIRSLALVPDDQAHAWWTSAVDEIVPLPAGYLDIEAVLAAAKASNADALHPGYGFLAENPDFAEAVTAAGITWVGPPAAAMRALGEKAAARRLARALGVPVLSGYDGDDQSDLRLTQEANRIGFPVLLKPSAGGGGKGMHVARAPGELSGLLERARREALAAFADDRLVLERYVARPRHVEVQLLADQLGNAVHLGERDCSLQRRHQKVVEESPSPVVDSALRAELGEAALALARSAGYEGAGTAEFLLDEQGDFYFLELNARLQVEHPVTELVSGRDLVADQLRIAAGEPLGFSQADVTLRGHAIEARLYAEDPFSGFLPATGEILELRWPGGDALRVDAGVGRGDVVGTRYDPLLAKLITSGEQREQALDRLERALEQTVVAGLTTNRGFLLWLLRLAEFRQGRADTQLIDERWRPEEDLPPEAWQHAAAALAAHLSQRSPAGVVPGFRLNARPRLRIELEGELRNEEVPALTPSGLLWTRLDEDSVMLELDGRALRASLGSPLAVETAARQAGHDAGSTQLVRATMPGSVLAVRVAEGEQVEAGQVLLILEAMKMENALSAPAAARVTRVLVEPGQQVQRGEALVELA